MRSMHYNVFIHIFMVLASLTNLLGSSAHGDNHNNANHWRLPGENKSPSGSVYTSLNRDSIHFKILYPGREGKQFSGRFHEWPTQVLSSNKRPEQARLSKDKGQPSEQFKTLSTYKSITNKPYDTRKQLSRRFQTWPTYELITAKSYDETRKQLSGHFQSRSTHKGTQRTRLHREEIRRDRYPRAISFSFGLKSTRATPKTTTTSKPKVRVTSLDHTSKTTTTSRPSTLVTSFGLTSKTTNTSKPTALVSSFSEQKPWSPDEDYVYRIDLSESTGTGSILNVSFGESHCSQQVCLSPSTNGRIYYELDGECFGLTFTESPRNSSSRKDIVGTFYIEDDIVCPQVSCSFGLQWNHLGVSYRTRIKIPVYPGMPPECIHSIAVSERGAFVTCGHGNVDEERCNSTITNGAFPIDMELQGNSKDRFFMIAVDGTYRVFARGDSPFNNGSVAKIAVRRRREDWSSKRTYVELFQKKPTGYTRSTPVIEIETSQKFGIIGKPFGLACSHSLGDDVNAYLWTFESGIEARDGTVPDEHRMQIWNFRKLQVTDSGYYTCRVSDSRDRLHTSARFKLDVVEPTYCPAWTGKVFGGEVNAYQKKMLHEAIEAHQLYYEAMVRKYFFKKYYVEEFSNTFIHRNSSPNEVILVPRIQVMSFGNASNCIKFTENDWIQLITSASIPDSFFDARQFLSGAFKSVIQDTTTDTMTYSFGDGYLRLNTTFTSCVEHRTVFAYIWTFNGTQISPDSDNSPFQLKKTVTKQRQLMCTVEFLMLSLQVKDFSLSYFGEYRCEVIIAYSPRALPWTLSASKTIDNRQTDFHSEVTPTVKISPTRIEVPQGENVTFSCNTNFGSTMTFGKIGAENEFKLDGTIVSRQYVIAAPNQPDLPQITVRCKVSNGNASLSDWATMRVVPSHVSDRACPSDALWPTTTAGDIVAIPCPEGFTGTVTRVCTEKAIWGNSSHLNCARESLTQTTDLVHKMKSGHVQPTEHAIENIVETVSSSVTSSKLHVTGDLANVIDVLSSLSHVANGTGEKKLVSSTVVEKLAKITDSVLSADSQVWATLEAEESGKDDGNDRGQKLNSGTKMLAAMDSLVKSSLNGVDISDSRPIVKENIMIKRDCVGDLDDIRFPNTKESYTQHNNWILNSNASAFLSSRALGDQNTGVCHAVILYKYLEEKITARGQLAKENDLKNSEIATGILGFSLNTENKLLSDLKLTFSPSPAYKRDKFYPQCAYLDTDDDSGMAWSSKHCRTEISDDGNVHCYCRHLTNFAVLMRPVHDEIHHKTLSIISLVGCCVSIICLAITLISYVVLWKYIKGSKYGLHICLAVSLLIAYLVLILGIERTENKAGCLVITVFLHYFLLVAFSVMLTEGAVLYIRVRSVFTRRSFGWKLYAPIFAVPFLIVCITVGSTWERGYMSPQFCWLNIDSGALWSLLIPIIVVVVTNVVLAVLVFKTMVSTHAITNLDQRNKAKAVMKAVCVITPLLGFTWVFGLFALHQDAIFFHYVFAILNSLQGLFIFICHCLLDKQIRDGYKLRIRIFKSRYLSSFSGSGATTTTGRSRANDSSKGDDVMNLDSVSPLDD